MEIYPRKYIYIPWKNTARTVYRFPLIRPYREEELSTFKTDQERVHCQ
jgi:hypothetical protein